MVNRPQGHGIRPLSLAVKKISALMAEVVVGNGDSPRIAIRWGYSGQAARELAKNILEMLPINNFSFQNSISLRFGEISL